MDGDTQLGDDKITWRLTEQEDMETTEKCFVMNGILVAAELPPILKIPRRVTIDIYILC